VNDLFALVKPYHLGASTAHPMARPALASLLVVAGGNPAAFSRLASTPRSRTLGRIQRPD
jgi:hypothetical protein